MLNIFSGNSKYKKFWSYFKLNQEKLFRFEDLSSFDKEPIFHELGKRLKSINESLTFEIGPIVEECREFTLSADGIEKAFPHIEALYDNKPLFSKLIIQKFRQPVLNIDDFTIAIDDVEVGFSDIQYKLLKKPEGITVSLFIPGYIEESSVYETLVFLILDSCLGEYDAVKKVSYCAGYNLDENKRLDLKPLKFLKQEFDYMYASIIN